MRLAQIWGINHTYNFHPAPLWLWIWRLIIMLVIHHHIVSAGVNEMSFSVLHLLCTIIISQNAPLSMTLHRKRKKKGLNHKSLCKAKLWITCYIHTTPFSCLGIIQGCFKCLNHYSLILQESGNITTFVILLAIKCLVYYVLFIDFVWSTLVRGDAESSPHK